MLSAIAVMDHLAVRATPAEHTDPRATVVETELCPVRRAYPAVFDPSEYEHVWVRDAPRQLHRCRRCCATVDDEAIAALPSL